MPYDYDAAWSMAGMFYVSGTTGTLIGVSNTTSNANWQLKFVDSTTDFLQLYIYDSAGNEATYSSPSSFSKNNWHYIYIYCNGANFYIYVDGVAHIASSWNIGAGNMKCQYITLSGIRFGSTVYEPIQFLCDEFRFHPGTVSSHSTLARTDTGMGQYMFKEVTDTASAPGTSYKFSTSGNVSQEIYSYRTSGYNYVYDISATFTNTAPVIVSSYPPDEYTYDTDPTITLAVNVTDADIAYSQLITAHFYVDDVSKGTAYRTSNGEITKNIGTFTGGTHEWYALVYDPWSGSVYTATKEFSVLSTLYIRDELTGELIDDAEVTVNFYSADTSVTKKSSNGTVDLTGLPTQNLLVTASAEGYVDRKTIVFSLYDTADIFLVNETANIIYNTFTLNRQTISGSPNNYILKVQKPMNGTVETVFCSYFDFDGKCGTYLILSDVYQLTIIGPDGSESTYGLLYPDLDGTIEIAYQSVSFSEYVNAWLVTNTTIDREAQSIVYAYQEAAQTNSVNPISVTGATMIVTDESRNTVYNVTVSDSSYVFQYTAAAEGRYNVNIAITGEDEDGTEFRYNKSLVVDFIDDRFQFMPDAYPDWLKMLIITFLCILILVSFGGYRSDLAAGLSFGLYAFSAYQGWISVSALALGVMFIVVMAAFFKLQRKIKRTG